MNALQRLNRLNAAHVGRNGAPDKGTQTRVAAPSGVVYVAKAIRENFGRDALLSAFSGVPTASASHTEDGGGGSGSYRITSRVVAEGQLIARELADEFPENKVIRRAAKADPAGNGNGAPAPATVS